jgi:hypothetical protein
LYYTLTILPFEKRGDVNVPSMTPERRKYLEDKYGLDRDELGSLLEELWAFTDETEEEFVRRRHGELQREGLRNDAIYRRLASETAASRFRGPELSLRQVRRIIYG